MALRWQLSPGDLARTVIQPSLGPFGEALLSFDLIRAGNRFGGLHPWPRNVRASVSPLARHASALFKIDGPIVDLFTPIAPHEELAESLDDFLRLPDRLLADEIRYATDKTPLPRWTAPMAGTDRQSRRLLARAISDMASTFVTPYWTQMQSYLQSENSAAVHRFLGGGLENMLSHLHPCIRWDPPWLTVGCGPVRAAKQPLDGQGIVFVPAVHLRSHPAVFRSAGDDQPLLVVYPAVKEYADVPRLWRVDRDPDALARLIGPSRTELLATIRERPGLSVRELAAAVGLSTGAASEHVAVLRNAGLVSGRRHGKALIHTPTALGSSLLDGSTAGNPESSRSSGPDSP